MAMQIVLNPFFANRISFTAHVFILLFAIGLSTQTENIYRIAMEIVVNVRASVIRGSVKHFTG